MYNIMLKKNLRLRVFKFVTRGRNRGERQKDDIEYQGKINQLIISHYTNDVVGPTDAEPYIIIRERIFMLYKKRKTYMHLSDIKNKNMLRIYSKYASIKTN